MAELLVTPKTAIDNSAGLTAVRGVHETNEARDVSLLIQRKGPAFRLKVLPSPALEAAFPDGIRECDIPMTPAQLWGAVQRCRSAWRKHVIDAESDKVLTFQQSWDFAADPSALTRLLGPLAIAGAELFNDIFFPTEALADPDAYRVLTATGEALRHIAYTPSLWIRVTSDEFYAPWNLIYSARLSDKRDGKDAVPQGFWGYAHLVEHVPERGKRGTDLAIGTPVRMALYLDSQIDTKLSVRCNAAVESDLALYTASGGLQLARQTTSGEMLASLEHPPLDAHLIYFCCHAAVDGDGTNLNADDAYLALTDMAYKIGPARLRLWLDQNVFTNGPIVFLNACQTAQMNSLFYQGFVPTFMDRRASAFIGTQTEIPAVFAGEFARRFFECFFIGGQQRIAGRVLLELRRTFLDTHHNPLGLLYSIYRGADVYLRDALPRASSADPITAL